MGPTYDPTLPYPYDYKTGVMYTYQTQLPAGPHTYDFEANDGIQRAMWPRRPDHFTLTNSKALLIGTTGGYPQ